MNGLKSTLRDKKHGGALFRALDLVVNLGWCALTVAVRASRQMSASRAEKTYLGPVDQEQPFACNCVNMQLPVRDLHAYTRS